MDGTTQLKNKEIWIKKQEFFFKAHEMHTKTVNVWPNNIIFILWFMFLTFLSAQVQTNDSRSDNQSSGTKHPLFFSSSFKTTHKWIFTWKFISFQQVRLSIFINDNRYKWASIYSRVQPTRNKEKGRQLAPRTLFCSIRKLVHWIFMALPLLFRHERERKRKSYLQDKVKEGKNWFQSLMHSFISIYFLLSLSLVTLNLCQTLMFCRTLVPVPS